MESEFVSEHPKIWEFLSLSLGKGEAKKRFHGRENGNGILGNVQVGISRLEYPSGNSVVKEKPENLTLD